MARGPYGETHDGSDLSDAQRATVRQLEAQVDAALAGFDAREGASFRHPVPAWMDLNASMRRWLTNRYRQAGWGTAVVQQDGSSEILHLRLR